MHFIIYHMILKHTRNINYVYNIITFSCGYKNSISL